MAGEIEEPICNSFQAGSIHSGSVSFGRFEKECLSWERRSSFSHNRYMEEVEQCSKPGSVIEKKAYFEAHFKKKGLFLPVSLEGQTWRNHPTGDTDVLDNEVNRDEVDSVHKGDYYYQLDESFSENLTQVRSAYNGREENQADQGNDGNEFEYPNKGNHYGHYDESHEGSEYLGVYELTEFELEDNGPLSVRSKESALNNTDILVESVMEDAKTEEGHTDESGCQNIPLDNDEQVIEVKDDNTCNEGEVGVLSKPTDSCANVVMTSSGHSRHVGTKRGGLVGSKSSRSRLIYQANISHSCKGIPRDASKHSKKSQTSREIGTARRSEAGLQGTVPARRSSSRSPKVEGSASYNPKTSLENKSSRKEQTLKITVESPQSTSKKIETRNHHAINRLKQTVDSTKPEKRHSVAAYNLRSGERPERRKEETAEAEAKHIRKNENFKPTTKPPFYTSAARPGIHNKSTSSDTRSVKVRNKPTSGVSGGSTRSKSLLKAEKRQPTDEHEPRSEAGNGNAAPKVVKRNGVSGNKGREEKDTNMQRRKA